MVRLAVWFCLCFALIPAAWAAEAAAPPGGTVGPEQPEKAARPAKRPRSQVREILLTFDDGPRVDLTPRVLDLLDAHGIKAVFFVNGWRFQGKGQERAREILRDALRRGHLVGNHTVHHYFLCGKRGPQIAQQEIEENAVLIEQATGLRPPLFRTPYGAHCPTLNATLKSMGIKPIGWDIDPQDWRLRDADKVLAYMKASLHRARGRSIVLFHDVQPATVAMLPRLLDWIDEENAAARAAGEPELKIIDYSYLLPDYPILPPIVDALGRLLVEAVRAAPLPAWVLAPLSGWLPARA